MEIYFRFVEKKMRLLQKIFEHIAQWVQGWWKGEEVRTWGDTFVWHLNWDKCPRLFSCWTSEKKSDLEGDGKMGLWITLNCKYLAWAYPMTTRIYLDGRVLRLIIKPTSSFVDLIANIQNLVDNNCLNRWSFETIFFI